MARDFNGSSDYLSASFSSITDEPITMACWFNSDSVAADQTLISLGNNGTNGHWRLIAAGAQPGDTIWAQKQQDSPATTANATSASGYSANTWQHAAAVFSSNTSRTAYLNGAAGTANTTSLSDPTPDFVSVGVLQRSSNVQFMDGEIAEAAIWTAALNAAEIAALAKGLNPLLVRPDSLVAYWPIYGRSSPEIDVMGVVPLALSGSPAQSDHPPIIRRRRAQIFVPKVVASITPPNGSTTLVGYAPSLVSPQSITPDAGGLSLTGLAAALSTAFKLTPDVGTLSIQGYAPSLAQNFSISPDTGALALLGSAPGLIQGFLLTPDAGSLALAGYAPSLGSAGAINPSDGTLTLVGYQPGVTQQSFIVPGAGSLTITGLTPSVAGAGTLIPSEANLTLVGYQPGVTQQTFIVPGVGAISVESHAPLLVGSTYVVPGVGAATFAGYAPTVGLGTVVTPSTGQILLAGGTPSVIADSGSSIITPASGSLGFVGYAPTVLTAVFVTGNGRVFWLPAQSVEWVLRAQSTEWVLR